jgi:sporulation protein YqfC
VADLRDALSRWLDLPEDVTLDLPRLRLLGDLQVLVENHLGVRSFHEDEAVVATKIGDLLIYGADLRVGAVSEDAVLVTGRIEGLRYRRG